MAVTHPGKYTVPNTINHALNCDAYPETVVLEKKFAFLRNDFVAEIMVDFYGDKKKISSVFVSPRPNHSIPNISNSTATSTSFFGGSCNSCSKSGLNHGLNKQQLFIISDEHLPPAIGSNGECIPVLRVNQGDFKQAYNLLQYHVRNGLVVVPGSIIGVFMFTHLIRSGQEKYWLDLCTFISYVEKEFKVKVIPGLPPFPEGQTPSALISISQFIHHLRAVHTGLGVRSGKANFLLWKIFNTMNYSANTVAVPSPPLYIPELNSTTRCTDKTPTGFSGDWTAGPPTNLCLQFITSLFNCLDSNEISVTFPLPNITAIQRGVLNKPSLERRIYLFGNSIMRQVSEELADLCEEESNGVSMSYQRLEVDTNIYLIDASSLKNSTKDDILILHHLGNSLLMKDKFFKDQGCYHLVNPRIPEDDEMSLMVAKLTKLLRFLLREFMGKIFIIGPYPRHIDDCCDLQDHKIRGPSGENIYMSEYASCFTEYLIASPGIVQDRVGVIPTADIDVGQLVDGVHLTRDANKDAAKFILGLLSRKPTPATASQTLLEFNSFLSSKGIVSDTITDADNMAMSIDSGLFNGSS